MPLTPAQRAIIQECSKDEHASQRLIALFESIQAQEQSSTSAELRMLRNVLDAIPDRIYVKDRDSRFIMANRATWRHHQLIAESELLGKTDVDLFGEDGRAMLSVEQYLMEAGASQLNREHRLPDRPEWADRPYALITKVPLYDEQGDVIGLIGVNRDISDLKRVEEELRRNQYFAVQVTLAIPDVIFVYDLEQDATVYCNDQIVNLLGITPEAVQAMGSQFFPTLMHPEDWLRFHDHIRRYARAKDSDVLEFESRMRHANGTWRWIIHREMIFKRSESGKPIQILGVAHDITSRKEAEATVRQNETQKHALINAIPDMIAELNGAGVVLNFKPRAGTLAQVQQSQFIGRSLHAIYPSPLADELLLLTQRALITGQMQVHEYQSPYGGEWALREARIVAVDRDRAVIISRDITERKAVEQSIIERERLQTALQKEQELSLLKSRMMTRISHEFRTPLAVILASTELLWHYGARMTPERRQEHFERIHSEIDGMSEMLRSIALIMQPQSKTQLLDRKACDLGDMALNVVERMRAETAARHIIAPLIEGDLLLVPSEESSLERMISHLLLNAVKYAPAETTIDLRITRQNGRILLCVADHGIGIPREDQPRIFEPFFRGSNVGDVYGMGLGLALVKYAVDLHDGSVEVKSDVGEGTTVTVSLPASP